METANLQNNPPEIWQVEVNGQIYDTNIEEMKIWIAEGSLLPADKVRRGNLRWLEANKVPGLYGFFNAKELGISPPNITTTTNTQANIQNLTSAPTFSQNEINIQQQTSREYITPSQTQSYQNITQTPEQNSCVIHTGAEPKFSCETCLNLFCKACPNSYGSVKICPMCGAMCKPLAEIVHKHERQQQQFYYAKTEGFGFGDFGNALAFPFKFKASLIFGAIMFMFFTLGQSAAAIGGVYMIVAAIFCAMLANTLTFGVLANTVENFSQGKIETNFMPGFDDFSIWDDVLHPFFLSIGVYLSSFGPLIVLIIAMFFFVSSSLKTDSNTAQEVVNVTAPDISQDYADSSQTGQIKGITDKVKDINNQHNQQIESVENSGLNSNGQKRFDEEKYFKDLNDQINQTRQKQLESTFGQTPETDQTQMTQFAQKISGVALPFLFLAGLAFLWGLFYMPAACAVAGYTRNFISTINPVVGLDTIKRLGVDYVKILGMSLLLSIISGCIGFALRIIFSPFNLPRMGNLPAIAVGGLFTFYFSVVFSVILGYALYKNAEKLNLYR